MLCALCAFLIPKGLVLYIYFELIFLVKFFFIPKYFLYLCTNLSVKRLLIMDPTIEELKFVADLAHNGGMMKAQNEALSADLTKLQTDCPADRL